MFFTSARSNSGLRDSKSTQSLGCHQIYSLQTHSQKEQLHLCQSYQHWTREDFGESEREEEIDFNIVQFYSFIYMTTVLQSSFVSVFSSAENGELHKGPFTIIRMESSIRAHSIIKDFVYIVKHDREKRIDIVMFNILSHCSRSSQPHNSAYVYRPAILTFAYCNPEWKHILFYDNLLI